MKNYLPSRKFVIRTATIAILLIVAISVYKITLFIKDKLTKKDPVVMTIKSDVIQKDSNNNGIPDWEESLWGLDPKGDGVSNKEFIMTQKEALAKENNVNPVDNQPLSENETRATCWRQGLININTAPHEVLATLFYGITPTSDQRFTNSTITTATAEELSTFLEQHRPYEKLSDLAILTPLLANATTYTPSLSINVSGENPPLAAVFDRAREEGFGKMISLCTVQSRAFRAYILGQSLTSSGKPVGEALLEASIVLLPSKNQHPIEGNSNKDSSDALLIPVVQKREWLR